jgi:hypothetical protein
MKRIQLYCNILNIASVLVAIWIVFFTEFLFPICFFTNFGLVFLAILLSIIRNPQISITHTENEEEPQLSTCWLFSLLSLLFVFLIQMKSNLNLISELLKSPVFCILFVFPVIVLFFSTSFVVYKKKEDFPIFGYLETLFFSILYSFCAVYCLTKIT